MQIYLDYPDVHVPIHVHKSESLDPDAYHQIQMYAQLHMQINIRHVCTLHKSHDVIDATADQSKVDEVRLIT